MATVIRPGHVFDFDPDAKLLYAMDWADWLAEGAGIASSAWTIQAIIGDADPVTSDNASVDGTMAVARFLGGTAGNKYRVTNHIATDETPVQEDDRSFFLKVKER